MKITLRSAKESDIEWLDSFYENLMRPFVELTHQWNTTKFKESFIPDLISIVMVDDEDIGMLKTVKRDADLYLGDIQIHTKYQNRGIGSQLVEQVLAEAKVLGFPVRLRVLKGNPAYDWYLQQGFTVETELDNCYQLIKVVEQDAVDSAQIQ